MENKDSEIFLPEEAPCDFNELVSAMEPSSIADTLSVYLDSCEPFSAADLQPPNYINEPNTSRTDALVDPFNSIVLNEFSEPKDNDVKDSIFDLACGSKVEETKRSSTRRSTREKKTISNQKTTDTKVTARKSRRTSKKKQVFDLLAADVGRRRRSDLGQRVRPSTWGLGGKIDEIFKQNAEKIVEESRKVRRGGKRNNDFVNQSVQIAQGEREFQSSNKGLLLKLKIGTKAVPTCHFNTIPDMEKDLESYREVKVEASALQSNVKDNNYEKEVPRASNEDLDKEAVLSKDSVIDTLLVDRIVESVENSCLDPGTSPDSEVINVIPETQVSGISAEGLHDIRVSSKDCVSHQSGDVGSGIPSPEILNDALLLGDKFDQIEKQIEGSWSSGASMSISTEVASLQETEVAASTDMLLIIENETKSNGQNQAKSSRSGGITGVSNSVNKKKTNSRQIGSQAKSAPKGKVKADCETENHPVTGDHEMNDVNGIEEASRSTVGGLIISATVPSEEESRQGSPRSAWVCCDDCHKWRRISAILADSIESTECRWICKDNLDKTFADCSIPQEKSNADINEELELSEASGEEDASNTRLNSSHVGQKQQIDPPLPSWKLIKTNMFLHRNRKNQTIDEIMVCHCKPPLDGRMGCRDECLNRMLNIECVKGTCPCGEFCGNQQFQKRKYSKLKCFPCGKKGFGLQSQEDIPKGRFLIEYVGEVLDMHAYEARQREYASKGHKHFYFMTLNGSEVIDACAKGNLGRFINHSCEPNCRTEKWMVNGEVCIGLFAIRDIKEGEELTFDYNYVRVFGAAAKKCVCGSSRCRGVIGGDPLSDETVVGDSDDEWPEPEPEPEPVTLYDNISNKSNKLISGICTLESSKNNDGVIDKFAAADSLLLVDDKNGDTAIPIESREVSFERSSSATSASESKIEHAEELLPYPVQPLDSSIKANDAKSEISSLDANEKDTKLNGDSKKKPKSQKILKKCTIMKPQSRSKIPSSTMKKGKSKNGVNKPPEMDSKPIVVVPSKPKRIGEDALTGRFEAVQEALNTLLNADGGISKRRDGWKGYLKLLYLTAHGGKGEGIQSNRDLSMILDALLKTKSRTVLLDIINKNGLQMLHNLMKRYRKEFNKIPILRKLLKVLEFLAETKILTLENILKPSLHGAESFKESILSFTEHVDKQVHQIARNFRDRWIPRYARKVNNWAEREAERIEHQSTSTFKNFPSQHSSQPSPMDTRTLEGSSSQSCLSSSITETRRIRKRKSRWDEVGDIENPSQKPKVSEVNVVGQSQTNNEGMDCDGDAPPGFSSPINRQLSSTDQQKPVMAYPQERFNSRIPIDFGIRCSVIKQIGTPKNAIAESWIVAPATTFHPFPPLPKHPPQQQWRNSNSGTFRNPNTLGRRYYRQQKWSNSNSRSSQPWNNNKYGSGPGPAGFIGSNQSNMGGGNGYGGHEGSFYQQHPPPHQQPPPPRPPHQQ